jgi:vacuolar protein sorting-associated protein 13A/C
MLHLKIKPFIVGAKDWSGTVRQLVAITLCALLTTAQLQATTTLAAQISYWNLTNSHWEPRK